MYTYNYYKKFFAFYKKKKLQLCKKKISSPHNYIKKNYAKYKNGKPRAKFVIKLIEINSRA